MTGPTVSIHPNGDASANAHGVKVRIHPSGGSDKAIVVQIDTTFEPSGVDGGPGLRVLINDSDGYIGVPFEPPREFICDECGYEVINDDSPGVVRHAPTDTDGECFELDADHVAIPHEVESEVFDASSIEADPMAAIRRGL